MFDGMKTIRTLLIGLILGSLIGWFLGFLRLPYIEKIPSFLLGFIACALFVLTILALLFAGKKHFSLVRLLGGESVQHNSKTGIRSYIGIWIIVGALIMTGALLSSFLIYRQSQLIKTQLQQQNNKIQQQSELIESARKSSMVIVMNDILDKVDDELKNNPGGKLSDKTIAGIIEAFNYSFTPYRYLQGDSLSDNKLSPEKGQLLLLLCTKNLDPTSFDKIKRSAHFSGADLRKGDLHGVDLSGADLSGADLSNADLRGVSLKGADLWKTNLSGAHADQANFVGADLRRAVMSWAELNGAQMDSANLNGADLSNAQLRNADLHKSTLRAAKLDGALLNEANLQGVELIDASLNKANLTKANLTKADVNRAAFDKAIMTETELNKILNVDKDWFKKLDEWQITGATEIQKNYKVVLDTAFQEITRYRLDKI